MLTRRGLLRGLAQIAVLGPLALRRLPQVLEERVQPLSMIDRMDRAFYRILEREGRAPRVFYVSLDGLRNYASELEGIARSYGRELGDLGDPPRLHYNNVPVYSVEPDLAEGDILWADSGRARLVPTPGATV